MHSAAANDMPSSATCAEPVAAKLLGEGSKLQANLKLGPSLTFKISDAQVTILAEDQTVSVLRNPKCLSALVGQNVSVIRGYVEAKYTVVSTAGGQLDGTVAVKSNDLVTVKISSTNDFSVTDAKPTIKLLVLSDVQIVDESKLIKEHFLSQGLDYKGPKNVAPRIVFPGDMPMFYQNGMDWIHTNEEPGSMAEDPTIPKPVKG